VDQTSHGPAGCPSGGDPRRLAPDTQFYVYPPADAAVQQIKDLKQAHDRDGARRLSAMESTPQAVWFTSGAPSDVEKAVKQTMRAAAKQGGVPVLVAYNLPFRDCAQYSAGGATDTAAYDAWIDGFARGIGDGQAVVILEPDGLGLIPFNTTIYGEVEWCQPTVTDARGTPRRRRAPARPNVTRSSITRWTASKPRHRARPFTWTGRTATGWRSANQPTGWSRRAFSAPRASS
jgi:endoglucanase